MNAYSRQVRSVIERGYHDAYSAALVSTVLAAYERALEANPASLEETDAMFEEFYIAEKRAIDEARSRWGSLIEDEESQSEGGTA